MSVGVVVVDGDGWVIGMIFMMLFGDDYVMINMVIVDKLMCGFGMGCRFMECVFEFVGKRFLCFIVIKEGLLFYEKFGFVVIGMIC